MKRIWIVTVGMSCGHELHDAFHEMELYGPFTKEEAELLAQKLEEGLKNGEDERLEAIAHPLDFRSSAAIVREYRNRTRE